MMNKNKKPPLKTILLSTILLVSLFLVSCGGEVSPKITTTTNVNSKWNTEYYDNQYATIKKTSEGLIFISSNDEGGTTTVKIGASLEYPDHHSSRKVTLVKTDDKGGHFTYESSFDHRSFGKELIEKDSGKFFVPWKAP